MIRTLCFFLCIGQSLPLLTARCVSTLHHIRQRYPRRHQNNEALDELELPPNATEFVHYDDAVISSFYISHTSLIRCLTLVDILSIKLGDCCALRSFYPFLFPLRRGPFFLNASPGRGLLVKHSAVLAPSLHHQEQG